MSRGEDEVGRFHAETVTAIRRVKALTGFWHGHDTIYPSPLFPKGATVTTSLHAHLDLAGHFIVAHEYRKHGDAILYQAVKVLGWEATCGQYTFHVFDTTQPNPVRPAFGTWRNNTLTLEQTTGDGHVLFLYTFEDDFHYAFRMALSENGEEWKPVIEGRYERQGQ
jgi:hypothetical protein